MVRKQIVALVLGVGLALAASGCVVGGGHHYDHGARYWDGRRWVWVEGHVHGPSCGHVHVGGRWVYGHDHTYDCYCLH